ncbi:MAG: M15 family metallopeptidase [Dehalococcoidia bacterium]
MTDSQRQRRDTVGGRPGDGWAQLNALAVGAVVIGAAALFVVIFGALARDGGGGGTIPPLGPPGGSETQTASAGETSTAPGENPANETPEPTGEEPETVACGDILAPVDKAHRLPSDCAPGDLQELSGDLSLGGSQLMRAESANAFAELAAAAARDGVGLRAVSAYRSYDAQVSAYEANKAIYGDDVDRFSARPGHSEHQLGTTVDVSSSNVGYDLDAFEGTAEAEWVAANSWRYGFIVSYPEGNEDVTGYAYEPWHMRYVGDDTAQQVRESGKTLHEYLLESR